MEKPIFLLAGLGLLIIALSVFLKTMGFDQDTWSPVFNGGIFTFAVAVLLIFINESVEK